MAYATVAQLRDYLPQIPASIATDARLGDILARASQVIDTEVGYSFTVPPTVSTRVVYGDGTDYLIPPPFVAGSVTGVTAPAGFTVPTYVAQGRARVVLRDGLLAPAYAHASLAGWPYGRVGGWLAGVPYTVTATYGHASVPADIVECCLEIAVRIWRGRDAGFSDVVGVEGSGAVGHNGALPALVRRTLDAYKITTAVGVW